MGDAEHIVELIEAHRETDYVDYKEKYYDDEKKYDLIKDIAAFANNYSSPNDKYIVFGIVNGTWELKGVSEDDIPDVSEIETLLSAYLEPFPSIEIGFLTYQSVKLAYIKITMIRIDRPYVIKKQYEKYRNIYLRIGEIYVRKGASNYIANRRDLDLIYKSNGRISIGLFSDQIEIGEVTVSRSSQMMMQARIILNNTFDHSVNICKMECDIISPTGITQLDGVLFEDKTRHFASIPTEIESKPILLNSGAEQQKSVFAIISREYAAVVRDQVRAQTHFKIRISLSDIKGQSYVSDEMPVSIQFYGNAQNI